MTTVEQSKIDAFRAKIEQRKACEKKAIDTSIHLIEADKIDDETLINSVNIINLSFSLVNIYLQAILIDQERYRGVNEDRALRNMCGYPLCSNALPTDVCKLQFQKLSNVL